MVGTICLGVHSKWSGRERVSKSSSGRSGQIEKGTWDGFPVCLPLHFIESGSTETIHAILRIRFGLFTAVPMASRLELSRRENVE